MRTPFPGMDPWLEHPALWPDVHHRLITAMADALTPLVAPRYYVAVERRTYRMTADELALFGVPDLGVMRRERGVSEPSPAYGVAIIDVEVPMMYEVGEGFLVVRAVGSPDMVTVIELLSPANKAHAHGRRRYLQKREDILDSLTNLVEIDLMRAGARMPVVGHDASSDYRILISRGSDRPRARLYTFGVRQPIPAVPIPLRPGDEEPQLPLNDLVRSVWQRGRFDLQLDYATPPVPPLAPDDAEWARGCLQAATS